jgi:hypothetical protein
MTTEEKITMVREIGKLSMGVIIAFILCGVIYLNHIGSVERQHVMERAFDTQLKILESQVVILGQMESNQEKNMVFWQARADQILGLKGK